MWSTPCEPAEARQNLKGFSILFFTGFIFSLADSPVQIDSGDFCVMSRRAIRTAAKSSGKATFRTGIACLARITAKAVSRFAGGTCSWQPQYSIQKTTEASFLRANVLFNKAIEDRTLMRQLPLFRRDVAALDLSQGLLYSPIFTSQRPGFQRW